MKRRIIILYDFKLDKKHWMIDEFEKLGYEVKYIDTEEINFKKNGKFKFNKIMHYIWFIKLAIKGIKVSNEEDIVISGCFLPGVFMAFIDSLLNIKRNIFSLNIITYERKGLVNYIRKKVYKRAFLKTNLISTCDSMETIDKVEKYLDIPKGRIFFLRDCSGEYNEFLKAEIYPDKYIFSGGMSNRDWKTLFEAAKICNNIKFKVVAQKKYWDKTIHIPDNVELFFDLPTEQFNDLMKKSYKVVIPLKENMTSGLVVMLSGIRMAKIVITSETEFTRNFYDERLYNIGLFKMHNSMELANKINIQVDDNEYKKNVNIHQKYLMNNCSPKVITKEIEKYFENFFDNNNI